MVRKKIWNEKGKEYISSNEYMRPILMGEYTAGAKSTLLGSVGTADQDLVSASDIFFPSFTILLKRFN